jgi:hypothetical protein
VLQVFDHLLAHPGLTAEDRPALEQAVAGVRNGLHFADALHHASCRSCASMASFDDRGFLGRIRQLNLAPPFSCRQVPERGSIQVQDAMNHQPFCTPARNAAIPAM